MTSSPASLPPEIARLSFEEAMGELEKLVRQLEEGKAPLEEAILAYERGAWLRRHCETRLREAQARIERIAVGANGAVTVASPGDV